MWPLVWCSGRVELVYPGLAAGVSVATAPSFLQTKQNNTSLPAAQTNPGLADSGSGSVINFVSSPSAFILERREK